MIDEANEILREKGYSAAHLNAVAAPLPGKVLLKGTKILSPFSDTAVPFSPPTSIRAGWPGNIAVVPMIVPNAPFANCSDALSVSSTSIVG